MKAHKYWSLGAFACMLMTMISGCCMKSKKAHGYWALGSLGCMVMSIYTGHKMLHRKPKTPAVENPEEEESKEDPEND